ncbi:uncharacterized protein LOC135946153 [Cloeon dipterum]|uniref:uncharacterized protein LOC135946153 n=1 Tax=Cloeon dipterum TaxID=197152 RepID=UPI00321FA78E
MTVQHTSMTTEEPTTTQITSTTTRKVVIYTKCEANVTKNKALFDAEGRLNEPDQYGFWTESCGRQFLFGKKLANWKQNFANCHKIDMEPIAFENEERQTCFHQMVASWKYGSNYWTSGLRLGASVYSWCKKNGTIPLVNANFSWIDTKPLDVGEQNCLLLSVHKQNASYQLSEKMCNDSDVFFACQGKPTPPPPCSSPVCPNFTCAKNQSYFTDTKMAQLTSTVDHGKWFTFTGRIFLFSSSKETFFGALNVCCGLGMSLLSLEYDYKYKSVIAAIKNNVTSSDYFWTSGSDKGCESNYGYCTAKRLLRKEAIWASGQPDNADGNESAVAVYITDAKAQLFDFNEESKYRYICEARDTSKAKSGGSAVRDECASVYNVSQAEIDTILNNTDKLDLRIKCFFKCLGENSGLMVNGKFLENELLVILENLADGNLEDLQKNMGIMDDCMKASTGMDECDKAAQMISCSNEKAPDVLNSVITAMDESIPMIKLPLPPDALCFHPSQCVGVPQYAQEIAACKTDCRVTYGLVKFCGSTKYYLEGRKYHFQDSFVNCCNMGMKLLSITTVEEVDCLATFVYPNQNDWSWVAVSQVKSSATRWCTSDKPFDASIFSSVTDSYQFDSFVYMTSSKNLSYAGISNTWFSICVQI